MHQQKVYVNKETISIRTSLSVSFTISKLLDECEGTCISTRGNITVESQTIHGCHGSFFELPGIMLDHVIEFTMDINHSFMVIFEGFFK